MANLTELLDRSVPYTGENVSLRLFLCLIGVPVGLLLFIKSDLFGGLVGLSLEVLLFGFGVGIYFLPAIKAYQDKKLNKQAILALNIFLGWTVVGWVVALVWAYTKNDARNAVAVAASPAVLCSSCGKYTAGGAGFCAQCGEKLARS